MSLAQVIPDSKNNLWLFYILPNGKVVLNGSLDYARNTFYQLKIFAKVGASWARGAGLPGKSAVGLMGALLPRTVEGCCTTSWSSRKAGPTCP